MVAEPKPEWIERIEAEHAQLRQLLEALEAKLGADESSPVAWGASVCETLDAIIPVLERHFAREEAAIAPDAAASVFPKLAQNLGILNRHHPRLLAAFRDAAGLLGTPDLDAEKVEEVTRRVRASIEAMRDHERAEAELFDLVELPE
ncbi:MAG: hemerythrin domain-containing protein [Myxococcales bacterium]|nr:hemerythrin domain-containing protein [Myxococcales bacterium]